MSREQERVLFVDRCRMHAVKRVYRNAGYAALCELRTAPQGNVVRVELCFAHHVPYATKEDVVGALRSALENQEGL
jgi:hypothetical protein